jgi:acyl carrier protein
MRSTSTSITIDRATVLSDVADILFQARGRELSDYVERARLYDDLGFESIDFLEIDFLLEEQFGFGFPTDDLGEILNGCLTPEFGTHLTPEEAAYFADRFKESFFATLPADIRGTLTEIPAADLRKPIQDHITVKFIVDYVIGCLSVRHDT